MSSTLIFQEPKVTHHNFLSNFILNFLKNVLPKKTKRLIFLASLLAMIEDIKNPSEETIRKLNQLLRISAKDVKSLEFPMLIHSLIWSDSIFNNLSNLDNSKEKFKELVKTELQTHDYRGLCDLFIKCTPDWLVYGSKQLMLNDLNILFRNMPKLLA